METPYNLSLTPLAPAVDKVAEDLVVFPQIYVAGRFVEADGLAMYPDSKDFLGDVKHVFVVQPGLPGDWILAAREKLLKVIQEREDVQALLLFPSGLSPYSHIIEQLLGDERRDRSAVWHSAVKNYGRKRATHLAAKNWQVGKLGSPHWVEFSEYTRLTAGVLNYLHHPFYSRKSARRSMHTVGHSYGAAALLYALSYCRNNRVALPETATFAAPFVKLDVKGSDPDTCLSVIHAAASGVMENTPNDHAKILEKDVLAGCASELSLIVPPSDAARHLFRQHRRTFNEKFYETLENLKGIGAECRVRVIRGERDPYIGPEHTDLVARFTGTAREDIETVLAGNGHGVEDLNFAEILNEQG